MDEDETSLLGSAKLPYDKRPSSDDEVSVTSSQTCIRQQNAEARFKELTETLEKTYNTVNSLIHSISACTEDGQTVKVLWTAHIPHQRAFRHYFLP